jgi:predicted choloylglycine hydrolase
MSMTPFTFRALEELELGPKWAGVFEERWPHYREWFLREGEAARASYATGARMLREHMPELVPAYERVVELSGGGDIAARMLSLFTPPPFLAACSQGVFTRSGGPVLARNYDYAPSRFEGLIWSTRMLERRVIGTSDCLWGLLDGLNEDGLAVSLTFGGRRVLGEGFGIPIVVRYLLEVCETVHEARAVLARLPFSLAHNLTLVDRTGEVLTAYVAPDRPPIFRSVPAATNHQGTVEWPEQAAATRTIEREQRIVHLALEGAADADEFAAAFLRAPLFSTAYATGWGTLYTAVVRPVDGSVEYRWPTHTWRLGFDRFAEGEHIATLADPAGVATSGEPG